MAGEKSLGALNLYGSGTDGFTRADEQFVVDIGPAMGAFLANAQAYWHAFELTDQLNQALSSRAVIDQAKGIVMAGDPTLDADGAFEVLKTASQRENVKIRDIAKRIVERRPPPSA